MEIIHSQIIRDLSEVGLMSYGKWISKGISKLEIVNVAILLPLVMIIAATTSYWRRAKT